MLNEEFTAKTATKSGMDLWGQFGPKEIYKLIILLIVFTKNKNKALSKLLFVFLKMI